MPFEVAAGSRERSASYGRRKPRAEKILDALEELLNERRLREIDVEHIAAKVGVTRPRFYYYFPSKNAAMAALLERSCDEVFQAHIAIEGTWYDRPSGVRPRDSLYRAGLERTKLFARYHRVFLEASDMWNSPPEIRDVWMRLNQSMITRIKETIERERERGVAPPGPEAQRLAESLWWMGERLLFFTYAGISDAMTGSELLDLSVQIFMRTIYLSDDPDPD
jgi:TetR/AcrR family transcriptional regulator, ethionamide resistance regulator